MDVTFCACPIVSGGEGEGGGGEGEVGRRCSGMIVRKKSGQSTFWLQSFDTKECILISLPFLTQIRVQYVCARTSKYL